MRNNVAVKECLKHSDYSFNNIKSLVNSDTTMVYKYHYEPPHLVLTFVSESCLGLTGYTAGELLSNSSLTFFSIIHPDDVDRLAQEKSETLTNGLPLESAFRIICKNQSIKWIWERSRITKWGNYGFPVEMEGFYTDITKQHQLEPSPPDSRFKLQFLANMSHEIRTPMNAIIGITELALREDTDEIITDYLCKIKSASSSLLTILNDILDFSKMEAGKLEILPTPYSISSLINDVSTITCVRMNKSVVNFEVDDNPLLPNLLLGDSNRIKQIMLNLLTNAVKFTKSGFFRLTVDFDTVSANEIMLNIQVKDSGIGIKPEDQSNLFEKFTQFDSKNNYALEGTGLGLAITKNLVQLMGGTISVNSMYGKGTTFSVSIPQTVLDCKPMAELSNCSKLKIGICMEEKTQSQFLAIKLSEMNVKAVVLSLADWKSVPPDFSHIIFDSQRYDMISKHFKGDESICFIAVYHNYLQENSLRNVVKTVYTPLTSSVIAAMLNQNIFTQYPSQAKYRACKLFQDITALIVDDNDINLQVSSAILEGYGIKCDVANSGKQSIEMLTKQNYDIIFMDHMMPEMDGVDTTKIIRSMNGKYFRQVPIIALTANAINGVKELFLSSGMNDFVSKPMDLKELERVLNVWIPNDKKCENYNAQNN